MPQILIKKSGKSLLVEDGANLMQVLLKAEIPVASSCHGDGICAKCRIQIIRGSANLSAPNETETFLKQKFTLAKDLRISCQTRVHGDIELMQATGESWAVLGASRGLGENFTRRVLLQNLCSRLLLSSRKIDKVEFVSTKVEIQKYVADFSREENGPAIFERIRSFKADRLFYFAGGGPFGEFEKKNWKDHQWAYQVNFLFPAYLLHQLWQKSSVQQFVFVGSAIAESSADPRASSYAASKHALKGLVSTLQAEIKGSGKKIDLRLFSPGYMDTALLPGDAWPRQQGKAMNLDAVTDQLLPWILNPNDANTHLLLPEKSLLK